MMALAWMGLMGAGGGDELVWTDQGVPNPGRDGEDEPPTLCSSCVGRVGKAALRPPDNMLPVLLPLPLMWWAMGESIWSLCGFREGDDGDAASASGEPRGSAGGCSAR